MINISASFVAEPIQEPLKWLINYLGFDDAISFSPYHQIFQELLVPGSNLDGAASDIGVLFIRIEDFIRDQPDGENLSDTASKITGELIEALQQFSLRNKSQVIISVLPTSPAVNPELRIHLDKNRDWLSSELRKVSNFVFVTESDLDLVCEDGGYDQARDLLAHIPYTESHYAGLALAIARKIHMLKVPAHKVLVLDCDNTLWHGVVGEDGVEGIKVSPHFAEIQRFAIEQQKRGALICLASKNVESDVQDALINHPDMLLKPEHIVAQRVNWLPKAANIQELASELNLGLDSFVFFDDNPVECGQIREQIPQVVTLQVPHDGAKVKSWLEHIWTFDKSSTTTEDAQRTQMYRENNARKQLETGTTDIGAFLAALGLKIDIDKPSPEEWPRISQLTHRTNQFNFTTRRRSVEELQALQSKGALVLRARVSDRFGDYGLVGVIVAIPEGDRLVVDTLLLSCRVLGRGVEHAMLRYLANAASEGNHKVLEVVLLKTPRNEPAAAFIKSVASQFAAEIDGGTLYAIPISDALAITHKPGEDPEEVVNARLADEKKGATSNTSTNVIGRSERYEALACSITNGSQLIQAINKERFRSRAASTPPSPAENKEQASLLLIWENLLGIHGLGIDDNYFDLGGTSLLSVQLFASIEKEFGVKLPLTTILEASTVRELAPRVSKTHKVLNSGIVTLRLGVDRPLFFIHDGLGETLLYLNLARRIPSGVPVYGVEPKQMPNVPLAYSSMEALAEDYVERIRTIQPNGPYRLGGMCAGGVISYAMACYLTNLGETVEFVLILDGATPQAEKRGDLISSHRAKGLQILFTNLRDQNRPVLDRLAEFATQIIKKISNTISWEISKRWQHATSHYRFASLARVVNHKGQWPTWLRPMTVQEIFSALESRYEPKQLINTPVILIRASQGIGNDLPYREMYVDEALGWKSVANQLHIYDVSGGHASMLQENFVDSLWNEIRPWISDSSHNSTSGI